MLRLLGLLALMWTLAVPAFAQEVPADARAATGGAQNLEDIMRRQEGAKIDDSFRSDLTGNPDVAAATTDQLGTLGGASDPDLWRALRYGLGRYYNTGAHPAATTLMQDGGMWWLSFREGPLLNDSSLTLLGGTLLLLTLFYLARVANPYSMVKRPAAPLCASRRLNALAIGLLASSFIVLGITGLISLFGRKVLIPAFGHETFSFLAVMSKWVHNNISWAFMVALVIIFCRLGCSQSA